MSMAHLGIHIGPAGWVMILLAAGYVRLAEVLWQRAQQLEIPPPATALYAVGFVVTAVGLLLSSFRTPLDATLAYALGALVFLRAGWRLREALLGYAVAGLLAAAYVTALVGIARIREIPAPVYGIMLVPGIAIFLTVARLIERRAASKSARILTSWAGPFYVGAHVGTAAMVLHSIGDRSILPVVLALAAGTYGVSAAFFRSPLWLYPALLAAHAAMFFGLLQLPIHPRVIPLVFVPVTIALVAVARRIDPLREFRLGNVTWTHPLYLIALGNLILWELVGVLDAPTHIVVSLVFAALAATIARWWQTAWVASLSLMLVVVGFAEGLRWLQAPYPTVLLTFSFLALFLGTWAAVLQYMRRGMLWLPGSHLLAFVISGGAMVTSLAGVLLNIHPQAGAGLVYTLAIVGLLYLLYAILQRREWLGYLAVAMLEAAWAIFLLKGLQVREIQWYAIPGALYLLGMGIVERRLGRKGFAQIIDLTGMTLLFGSSLWQSLGSDGFRYALLLAIEALLVTWFGATQRLRRHFFAGLGVLVVDVVIQGINPLRALDKTILFLSLGILLIVTAVLAERKREDIIRTTREWRVRLGAWE